MDPREQRGLEIAATTKLLGAPLAGLVSGFSRLAIASCLCPLCLCVKPFFSSVCDASSVRKYYTFHSKLVPHRNSILQTNFLMLPCAVNYRRKTRRAFQFRHVTKILSPQVLCNLHLQNCDARNSFRFRSYENSRVSPALSSTNSHSGTDALADHPGLSWNGGCHSCCFKSFSCNTYRPPRKCCKQKTYGLAKLFTCNTYKKHGGGGPGYG